MKDIGKKIHGALFLLILAVVALQTLHPFVPNGSLIGAVITTDPVPLSVATLIDGSFMESTNKLCDERLGFKPALAKTNNQINYSLFNYAPKTNSNLIRGKDGWLYEGNYLYSRIQECYLPDNEFEKFASDLKIVQDFLQSKGADIYFIIAPSKATIYPEYAPQHFQNAFADVSHTSIYQKVIPLLAKHEVNYIDGVEWFLNKKAQKPDYLLFCRGGIHWSDFAGFEFLQDALIEINKSPFIEIPPMEVQAIETHPSRGDDRDLASLMNIWNQNEGNDLMPYPIFKKHPPHSPQPPITQYYGDSFSWNIIRHLVRSNVVPHLDMQYYNLWTREYKGEAENQVPLKEVDMEKFAQPGQLIILTCNEISLPSRMWGFTDKALKDIQKIQNNTDSPDIQ
jgi:hypothetical protein